MDPTRCQFESSRIDYTRLLARIIDIYTSHSFTFSSSLLFKWESLRIHLHVIHQHGTPKERSSTNSSSLHRHRRTSTGRRTSSATAARSRCARARHTFCRTSSKSGCGSRNSRSKRRRRRTASARESRSAHSRTRGWHSGVIWVKDAVAAVTISIGVRVTKLGLRGQTYQSHAPLPLQPVH